MKINFYNIFLCKATGNHPSGTPHVLATVYGRNGKHTTVASAWRCGAENPFARSEPGSVASSPEGSESPITTARGCCKQPTGFFRQILLVVKPKTDFHKQKSPTPRIVLVADIFCIWGILKGIVNLCYA